MNETRILQLLEKIVEGQEALTKEVQDIKKEQKETNTRLDNQDKRLDSMDKRLDSVDKRLDNLEHTQAQTNEIVSRQLTAIEALPTKQDLEATVETAKAEIQATILDQIAKLMRILHKYKVRLEHLEKHTGTTDPTQN